MRVVGVEIPGTVTAGGPVFIPLDTLTVLLGANDVGKTRTLRCVADTLSADPSARPGDPSRTATIFVLDHRACVGCAAIAPELLDPTRTEYRRSRSSGLNIPSTRGRSKRRSTARRAMTHSTCGRMRS